MPFDRSKYPKNWPEIRDAIRARGGNACEGSPDYPDCRRQQYSIGYVNDRGEWAHIEFGNMQRLAELQFERGDVVKLVRIVLTVAHMDHGLSDHSQENLRLLCQRCHLHHDRHQHAATAHATRRAKMPIGDLFQGTP